MLTIAITLGHIIFQKFFRIFPLHTLNDMHGLDIHKVPGGALYVPWAFEAYIIFFNGIFV